MDELSRSWYEMAFERDFVVKRGTEFQSMFAQIMGLCHPDDFVPVKPWGNIGDEKNDGYLRSERRLFQVYAPERMQRAETESKMQEDFDGAIVHWKEFFDKWTFVHNSRDGVPPFVLRMTIKFERDNPQISCGQWSYTELRERLFLLSPVDLASVLGPAPTTKAMSEVRYEDLKHVLQHLQIATPPPVADLRPVPADKIAANGLSDDVEAFLALGMRKATLVEAFFAQWHDPNYGDAVAAAFKNEYQRLREEGLEPDAIFFDLERFAGGAAATTPRGRSAVLAILAHLFTTCDIYERARQPAPNPPQVEAV